MIPFYRPPFLLEEQIEWIIKRIEKCLRTGQITNGENVREFEERIKELHKVDYVIACSSATQGLWIVLEALKPETLMVQSFTWQSIKYILPLRPVTYCDIDKETWLMNPRVRTYWDFSPRAVIYTHTLGNTGIATVETEGQNVIYDGAYSMGVDLLDIGDATVLSTTAIKNVTSCEGGLILTNNGQLAKEMMEIRDKCSRMSELNAIVGLAYMDMLKQILLRKEEIFKYYIMQLPFKPQKISRYGTGYGFYSCLVPDRFGSRDEIIKKLEGKVEVRIRYEPIKSGLPTTDEIAKQIITLPCYPDLDEREVVNIIRECVLPK